MAKFTALKSRSGDDFPLDVHGFDGIVYKKDYDDSPDCYMIVTCRSFAWTVLTIIATTIIIISLITPQWLVGRRTITDMTSLNGSKEGLNDTTANLSIGLFNHCTQIHTYGGYFRTDHCATYVTGFGMPSDEFPDAWKAGLIMFSIAIGLLGFTCVTALLSLCIQSLFKKSIFTVSGLIQSVSALFMIFGLVLYPVGWNSDRVRNICGEDAGAFLIAECSIGLAYYTCIGGTALLFGCALLSIHAESSTSSDKVERKITNGRNIICVM